jgi:rhodanese-related sulfurtransferase
VTIALVLTVGCGQNGGYTDQIIEDVTPTEAFSLIQINQGNPDFVILDVRTVEEFQEESIENAVNLDYYSETFRDELNELNKDETYLLYCRSANRSRMTLDIMNELEFKEVYHMLGGTNGWKEAGLPTSTPQQTAYFDENSIPTDSTEGYVAEDSIDENSVALSACPYSWHNSHQKRIEAGDVFVPVS